MPSLRSILSSVLASILSVLICTPLSATNYRVIQDKNGKFWFADDSGKEFLSIGLNHIAASDHEARPNSVYYNARNQIFGGDLQAWRTSVFQIMRDAGFNTIGAWSDPELNDGTLLETPILYAAGFAKERVMAGLSDGLEATVASRIDEALQKVNRDAILGVFIDNEMPWYGVSPWDDNPRHTILEEAMTFPSGNPARMAAIAFLQSRYDSAESFAQAWNITATSWDTLTTPQLREGNNDTAMKDRADFIGNAAEQFFSRTTKVIHEKLPGVLILGTRFAGNAPDQVIQACGKYCDVVSFNNYRGKADADARLLTRYWLLGGKPLMITEYGWRGEINASGNPNTGGAGSVLRTQKDRGEAYQTYVADNLRYPMLIGLHWFEWADQSPQGRFDGENSNYGVVNVFHTPYSEVLDRMAMTNASAHSTHGESDMPIPTEMPAAPKVRFEPGQFPERPARVEFLADDSTNPPAAFSADDASVTLSPAGDAMHAVFATGTSWGCGISFFGPKTFAIPGSAKGAVDLDGYHFLVFDAEAPAPMEFQIVLDEAGVAPPNSPSYPSPGTDDGESFSLPVTTAKPGRNTYRYDLSDLEARSAWGNQDGKRRVDLQSFLGPGLLVPPGQGTKELTIHSLRFEK